MELESNQPLDLSTVANPRVVYYYNKRPIDFYEYERIVHKSSPVYNSIYRPNYDIVTPSPPEFVPVDNLSSCSKDVDHRSNGSLEIAADCNADDVDRMSHNKTFVCAKRFQSFDEQKFSDHSSSRQKRNRYSSNCSSDHYNTSASDEDREIASFTNSSSATQSPYPNTSSSSINMSLRDSPLTVTAKQEQAIIERVNGAESLLKGLVYHGNMARRYPGADNRTPEQAEHRRKNSRAARLSRARAKAIDQQRDEVAARTRDENIRNKQTIATLSVYANELNKLLHREPVNWMGKWKRICDAKLKETMK